VLPACPRHSRQAILLLAVGFRCLPGLWVGAGRQPVGSKILGFRCVPGLRAVLAANSVGLRLLVFGVFHRRAPGAWGQPRRSKILGFRCLPGLRGGACGQPLNKKGQTKETTTSHSSPEPTQDYPSPEDVEILRQLLQHLPDTATQPDTLLPHPRLHDDTATEAFQDILRDHNNGNIGFGIRPQTDSHLRSTTPHSHRDTKRHTTTTSSSPTPRGRKATMGVILRTRHILRGARVPRPGPGHRRRPGPQLQGARAQPGIRTSTDTTTHISSIYVTHSSAGTRRQLGWSTSQPRQRLHFYHIIHGTTQIPQPGSPRTLTRLSQSSTRLPT